MKDKVEDIEYARYILIEKKRDLESSLLLANESSRRLLKVEIQVLEELDNRLLEKLREILY